MSGRPKEGLLGRRGRLGLILLVCLGGAAFALSLTTSPERAWRNLLASNFYFLSLSLVGAFFLALQYLSRAGWPTVFRRVPEAMVAYLPVGGILMLVSLLGAKDLYPWANPETMRTDPLLAAKEPFLNIPFFATRMVGFLLLWCLLSWLLVRRSRRQDESGDVALTTRNVRTSAIFTVSVAVTFSVASIDWIMSLEPHWYSTLFPWYVISSVFVSGTALIAVLVILLKRRGHLQEVNPHHLHNLGKYVFAFSVFWAYLWYSQYMLIWYTNIPEEVSHYVLRGHDWYRLFLLNLGVNLVVPFLFLVRAGDKKNPRLLLLVSLTVIGGHWLDVYLMVMPSFIGYGAGVGLYEGAIGVSFFALFLLLFDASLRRARLVPAKDPYLEESLHYHG